MPPRERDPTPWASTSSLAQLPPISTIETWVHLPQAVAKCSIADVYAMCGVSERTEEQVSLRSREVFMLNRFPCRSVEIVAWVAGVDRKEGYINLTLDDGDGEHVIIAGVRLAEVKPKPSTLRQTSSKPTPTCFVSAKDRRAARSAATATLNSPSTLRNRAAAPLPRMKEYARKDIVVGDTVRVVGRIDEWCRRKAGGSSEWIRQLAVDEGSGGSVVVVDQNEEFHHAATVQRLHETLYSRPFTMSLVPEASARHVVPSPTPHPPSSPSRSFAYTDSLSLAPSSDTVQDDFEPELRNPSKLSSSQLTDRTFRLYVLDHMTRETVKAMRQILNAGTDIDASRAFLSASLSSLSSSFSSFSAAQQMSTDPLPQLQALFPEYHSATVSALPRGAQGTAADSSATPRPLRPSPYTRTGPAAFSPSTKDNSGSAHRATATPPGLFRSKAEREADKQRQQQEPNHCLPVSEPSTLTPRATPYARPTPPSDSSPLQPFTTRSLLSDPTLLTLSELVVNAQARREEKARRQRMKDGTARAGDKQVEVDRVSRGLGRGDWKPTDEERARKALRLTEWTLRRIAEDQVLVQVETPVLYSLSPASSTAQSSLGSRRTRKVTEAGYLPLPPELLLPLLLPLFRAERTIRDGLFLSKTDPRRGNGMTLEAVMRQLRGWGRDGRWERVGEWAVVDAIEWGEGAGVLQRVGEEGWWLADGK